MRMAEKLKAGLIKMKIPFLIDSPTNQLFPILPDAVLESLKENYTYTCQNRVDGTHRAVRFCTSWATKEEHVDRLLSDIRRLLPAD